MQDIFLIGGSPSSGSTLLINLLGRHKNVLCLPETGLFAHGRNLTAMNAGGEAQGGLDWDVPWLKTQTKISQALGWRKEEFLQAQGQFETAFELIRHHIDPTQQYWLIEKTPENIFSMRRFLERRNNNRVVVTS